MRTLTAQGFVFLLGALAGTLLDQIHVPFCVLWYAHPVLLGQALWVPLVFGAGGLVLVNSHAVFLALAREREPPEPGSIAAPALFFLGAYLLTGVAAERPFLVLGTLTAAWAARVALTPSVELVAAGVGFAAGGPLFEAALSATGGFFYRRPDVLGVPCWLPALYLHASLLTRAIYLELATSCRRS